jgi:hypothetical protein
MMENSLNSRSKRLACLFRKHEELIVRRWVDEIYAEERTDLPRALSFEQLVGPVQEILDSLGRLLDSNSDQVEIADEVCHLRNHAQVRYYHGVLIDEVARELMLLREIVNEFLWRDSAPTTTDDLMTLREALNLANRFMDELLTQTLVIYATSSRPPVATRASVWPPPRRRKVELPRFGAE